MRDQDLYALPEYIRARFVEISDDEFASHPSVKALRKRLDQANAEHQTKIQEANGLRTRRADIEGFVGELKHTQTDLRDELKACIVSSLLEGVCPTPIPDPGAVFDPIIEAIPVALSVIDRRLDEMSRATRNTADRVDDVEVKLRNLLDELKLAEATRQAS